jgi:hemerythrin-like domain-containing protein
MVAAKETKKAERRAAPQIVDPIEFLFAQHDRQRVICAALDRLAAAPADVGSRETAQLILDYAAGEMPLHLADEEEDLFPRLRARCDPEDGLDNMVDQLEHEHETDSALYKRLEHALHDIAGGTQPGHPEVFASDARAFAMLQRRHLNWENGAILPLARLKLTREDLDDMRVAMAARRHGNGVD